MIISFVKLCQFALVLNKTLIQPDQEEFQVQLEAGYENLKKELQVPSLAPPSPRVRCVDHVTQPPPPGLHAGSQGCRSVARPPPPLRHFLLNTLFIIRLSTAFMARFNCECRVRACSVRVSVCALGRTL